MPQLDNTFCLEEEISKKVILVCTNHFVIIDQVFSKRTVFALASVESCISVWKIELHS